MLKSQNSILPLPHEYLARTSVLHEEHKDHQLLPTKHKIRGKKTKMGLGLILQNITWILTTPDEKLFIALEPTRLFSWKSNTGVIVSLPFIRSYFHTKACLKWVNTRKLLLSIWCISVWTHIQSYVKFYQHTPPKHKIRLTYERWH